MKALVSVPDIFTTGQVEHLTSEYAMPAWRDVSVAKRPAAAVEDDSENLTPDFSLLHVEDRRHRCRSGASPARMPCLGLALASWIQDGMVAVGITSTY